MAGRRTSLAALAGQKVEDVPGRSDPTLLRLPLDRLVPTRFNPRSNFGTDDDLREFGEALKRQQLHPAVIVSRAAYLKLWPGEADVVGSVPYVIANGERRYRAAKAVGLTHLDVVLREEVAASKAAFLDAVLSENIDRRNLDPIEQAHGVQTMVDELGSARAVAEHYGRHETWVSQQRALLKLTSRLQELVRSGEMPVRFARSIYRLPPAEQEAAWEEELGRRAEAKAVPRTRRRTAELVPGPAPVGPAEESGAFTAVKAGGVQPSAPSVPQSDVPAREGSFTAVKPPAVKAGQDGPVGARGGDSPVITTTPLTTPAAAAREVAPMAESAAVPAQPVRPEPAAGSSDPERVTVTLPLHDPGAVCLILRERMAPDALRKLARMLTEATGG